MYIVSKKFNRKQLHSPIEKLHTQVLHDHITVTQGHVGASSYVPSCTLFRIKRIFSHREAFYPGGVWSFLKRQIQELQGSLYL